MRLRNVPGAREAVTASAFVINDPASLKGCWHDGYAKGRPLYVEIGSGKGRFLYEMAAQHGDRAYLGIERYSSVLVKAVEKMEGEARDNLRFTLADAERLPFFFAKGEVAGIYLNFSDPWPKERHRKRRLTSREFLARYDEVLAPDGAVEFKTDNTALFDFTLEEAPYGGFEVAYQTRDLHAEALLPAENVMTEYEKKFSAGGNPIMKCILRRRG